MNAIAQRLSAPGLDDRRLLAGLFDLAIAVAGGALILVAAGALGGAGELTPAMGTLIVGWALYYHFACESGAGQTLGKKLMNLRVVRADGAPAGMREIALRTVLRTIDGLGIGLVAMKVTGSRRQRLGDLAAGTIVTSAEAPAVSPPSPPAESSAAEAVAPIVQTITLPSPPPAAPLEEEPPGDFPPLEDEPGDFPPLEDEAPADAPAEYEDELPGAELPADPPPEYEPPEDEMLADAHPEEYELLEDEAPADAPLEYEPPVDLSPVDLPSVEGPPVSEEPAPLELERQYGEDGEEGGPDDETAMKVKTVETVSAMDLVMGTEEETEHDGAPPGEPA